MEHMKICIGFVMATTLAVSNSPAAWEFPDVELTAVASGTDASFRGVAVRGPLEAWVTGSGATVLRTRNGGQSFERVGVPYRIETSADGQPVIPDFRDVELLPDGGILLMSVGTGPASKVLRSGDDGRTWTAVLVNSEAGGFFDGMCFTADGRTGFLYGDPVNGRMEMFVTRDGGRHWKRLPESSRPQLANGEYGFAASGTGAAWLGSASLRVATGGSVARVWVSDDGAATWSSVPTGIRSGLPSAGIFSIAFSDSGSGVAVGGDYLRPDDAVNNVVRTADGGATWELPPSVQMPHKACVRWVGQDSFVACGRTGVVVTRDSGRSWGGLSENPYYTCAVDVDSGKGIMAGPRGQVARLRISR